MSDLKVTTKIEHLPGNKALFCFRYPRLSAFWWTFTGIFSYAICAYRRRLTQLLLDKDFEGTRTDQIVEEPKTLNFLIAFLKEQRADRQDYSLNCDSEMLTIIKLLEELRERRAKDTK
jgi:hypothetical protein